MNIIFNNNVQVFSSNYSLYGDIIDDEIIGLKSTSIKFKNTPYIFLVLCYSLFYLSLIIIGLLMSLNSFFYIFLIVIFFHLFLYQLKKLDVKKTDNCLQKFKSNNFLGFLVLSSLIVGKIY